MPPEGKPDARQQEVQATERCLRRKLGNAWRFTEGLHRKYNTGQNHCAPLIRDTRESETFCRHGGQLEVVDIDRMRRAFDHDPVIA